MNAVKPTNPKDLVGTNKLPLHLVPEIADAHMALALLDGALKYGRENWRDAGVLSSVYVSAMRRHLAAYMSGEDWAPDGVHHLGHIMACCAILLDAEMVGQLTDDRRYHKFITARQGTTGDGYAAIQTELANEVKVLRERHAGKNPKHYHASVE